MVEVGDGCTLPQQIYVRPLDLSTASPLPARTAALLAVVPDIVRAGHDVFLGHTLVQGPHTRSSVCYSINICSTFCIDICQPLRIDLFICVFYAVLFDILIILDIVSILLSLYDHMWYINVSLSIYKYMPTSLC